MMKDTQNLYSKILITSDFDYFAGRNAELEKIRSAFHQAKSGKSRRVLLSGPPGIGKTALVYAFLSELSEERQIFLSGKYNQYQNSPYQAIRSIFDQCARYILSQEEKLFYQYTNNLKNILEEYSTLLMQISPEWEKIFQTKNRLSRPFQQENRRILAWILDSIISTISCGNRIPIIFLDDLQWLEEADAILLENSLSLLEKRKHLFIAAFRENEKTNNNTLEDIVSRLSSRPDSLCTLSVGPLRKTEVDQLIEGILGPDGREKEEISALAGSISEGNPLRLKGLLQYLSQNQLLFSAQDGWQWNKLEIHNQLPQFRLQSFYANQALSEAAQYEDRELRAALTVAAAIGNDFFDTELAAAVDTRLERIRSLLSLGEKNGFINACGEEGHYQFFHDTIQQSFYTLVPKEDREKFHFQIAEKLHSGSRKDTNRELWNIAYHYNKSIHIKKNEEAIIKILHLNTQAAQKALSIMACERAYEHAKYSMEIFQEKLWHSNYDLALDLFNTAIESAFLCGYYSEMEAWIKNVEQHALSPLEKAPAWRVRVQSCVAHHKLAAAIDYASGYSRQLGQNICKYRSSHTVKICLFRYNRYYKKLLQKKHESVPITPDPRTAAYTDIFSVVLGASYIINSSMFFSMIEIMIKNTLKKNNSYSSSFVYIGLALILLRADKYQKAHELAERGLDLVSSPQYASEKPKVYTFHALFLSHWKRHISNSFLIFKKGFESASRHGDLEFASICLTVKSFYQLMSGIVNLNQLEKEISANIATITDYKQERSRNAILSIRQSLRCIQGRTNSIETLDDDNFSEESHIDITSKAGDSSHLATFYIQKMFCALFFNRCRQADSCAKKVVPVLHSIIGQAQHPLFSFLHGLALIRLYRKTPGIGTRRKIRAYMRKVKKLSRIAPCNYAHRFALMKAEWARNNNDRSIALQYYERARKKAEENGSFYDRILIAEYSAEFFFELGMERTAMDLLHEAREYCIEWGTEAKARQLEEQFKCSLSEQTGRQEEGPASLDYLPGFLAYDTILKATKTMSRGPYINAMLQEFLTTIINISDADTCYFFSVRQKEINLQGMISLENDELYFTGKERSERITVLPLSLVNYSVRTEKEIRDSSSINEQFRFDSYIFHEKPQSLLCLPVKISGEIRSVIYLESKHKKRNFDTINIDLIVFLSTQLTMSIDREYLHQFKQKLEKENEERLLDLMQAEKLSSIGLVLSEIVHEVNNPNYCISLNANSLSEIWEDLVPILREYVDDDNLSVGNISFNDLFSQYTQIVESIRTSSRHIKSIVDDVRSFTASGKSIKQEPFDINQAIESTIIIATPFIKKSTDCFSFEQNVLPPARGDSQKIQQVLLNLIKNSCEAVDSRRKKILVSTDVDEQRQDILIKVTDEGCGIESEQLERITEPLFTTKKKENGLGLGLYVSKAIVKAHNGSLDIVSTPGLGTSVTIRLPFITAAPP